MGDGTEPTGPHGPWHDCHDIQGWAEVAAESNRAVDAYLRSICPDLPEHYGMPVDGVRFVVERLKETAK